MSVILFSPSSIHPLAGQALSIPVRVVGDIDPQRAGQPTSGGLLKILKSGSASLLLAREGDGIFEIDDECVGMYLSRAAKPIGFRRGREQPALQRKNRPARFVYCHNYSSNS
jgi:hypothetical protein